MRIFFWKENPLSDDLCSLKWMNFICVLKFTNSKIMLLYLNVHDIKGFLTFAWLLQRLLQYFEHLDMIVWVRFTVMSCWADVGTFWICSASAHLQLRARRRNRPHVKRNHKDFQLCERVLSWPETLSNRKHTFHLCLQSVECESLPQTGLVHRMFSSLTLRADYLIYEGIKASFNVRAEWKIDSTVLMSQISLIPL